MTSVADAVIDAAFVDEATGNLLAAHRLTLRHIDDRSAAIESFTELKREVWSHLNTFTQVTVAGHQNLRVVFSPAPTVAIDVKHAGYPFGSPARFAYLDRDRIFHIVEASSAEKGPFRELASGLLEGPLTIMLIDGEENFMELKLNDWADQLSVEPSPTAGWGVPQNVIEFSLLSDDPRSPASFFVSLASTSVGRGWNTVGHNPGVYRNRVTVSVPSLKP